MNVNFVSILASFVFLLTACQLFDISPDRDRRTLFDRKYIVEEGYVSRRSLIFNGEKFGLKKSDFDNGTITLKYYRDIDTPESWTKEITVVCHASGTDFDRWFLSYLKSIEPYQAQDPLVIRNDRSSRPNDIIIDALLLYKKRNRVEHVLSRNYIDGSGMLTTINYATGYSYNEALAKGLLLTDINQNREMWIKSLWAVEFTL